MEFWCYTFPLLILAAMVMWLDISVDIRLCKLENRIREFERAEEDE